MPKFLRIVAMLNWPGYTRLPNPSFETWPLSLRASPAMPLDSSLPLFGDTFVLLLSFLRLSIDLFGLSHQCMEANPYIRPGYWPLRLLNYRLYFERPTITWIINRLIVCELKFGLVYGNLSQFDPTFWGIAVSQFIYSFT